MKQKFLVLFMGICLMAQVQAQIVPNANTAPQLPLPTVPAAYNSNMSVNYVRTWEARQATADTTAAGLNNNSLYKTATAYVDGLGRPLQTVVKGNNYDGTKDIVSMYQYDEFGREVRTYLPYAPSSGSNGKFRINAFSEQQWYYHTNYQDQTPFSTTEFEASPLNRPLQTNAPGNSWAGSNRGVAMLYAFNTADDAVKVATIGHNSGSVPQFGAAYGEGQLIKTTTADEHGKKVVEYKDKSGLVLLKKVQLANTPGPAYDGWLCTYYVYDDFNRLRFVVQPKGVEWLQAQGWSFAATGGTDVKNELCFVYEYDGDGRMILKKVPGAAEVYMCYDKRDRLVYMQDGNMRNPLPPEGGAKWMVTFYDELNRPVSTALYLNGQSRSQLQSSLDNDAAANPVPVIAENLLTRLTDTYYDEYAMPGTVAYNPGFMATAQNNTNPGDEVSDPLAKTELTRGMVTGTRVRVLGTANFNTTTTYYDTKGRPVQSHSGNHRGGVDAASMVYSFTGKVLESYLVHNNPQAALPGTQTTEVLTRNTYNNNYLLKAEKQINGGGWKRILEMEYDDMGKAKKKLMGDGLPSAGSGSGSGNGFAVNMDYNIRGWLTGINKAAQQELENGSIGANDFYKAIFSEVLHYDYGHTASSGSSGGGGQFNGNISGIKWANASDKQARSYGYEYDNANRLLKADFTEKGPSTGSGSGPWNTMNKVDYSLTDMGYDANGNITKLSQKALLLNNSPVADLLDYAYQENSNKLVRVTDAAPSNSPQGGGLGDFKDGTNTGDDYAYDGNGSMTVDQNKGIAGIKYNHLNLPVEVPVTGKGAIYYTYDAAGNKLQKRVREGDAKETVTEYMSGFVYHRSYPVGQAAGVGDTLQFTGHEEGRIRYAKQYFVAGDSAYLWYHDYFYKDHLGNIRAVVTEQQDTAKYVATFETDVRGKETALFHHIAESAFPVQSIANYPADPTTEPNDYTSRLNGDLRKTGAAITLKVMAGDKVDLAVKYWYPQYAGIKDENPVTPDDLMGVLISALSGDASALSGGKATPGQLSQPGIVPSALGDFLATQDDEANLSSLPKAFLNWVLLDEQFKFVPGGSGFIRVSGYSTDMQTMAQQELPIAKSGYLFVYLSNETKGENVFFDNLVVQHYTGPLSETDDYTAWGLGMKMLSSKAFGRVENKKKYNGYEKNETFDLNLYESFYRTHDPQLGRFWQLDPKPTDFESLYAAMGNNPVKNFDILGDSVPKTKQAYFPAPKKLVGFPDAGKRQYNKESGRYRWRLKDGTILEWDKQHGEVEKYGKTGSNHLGAFDPNTGEKIKEPDPARSTPKFQGSPPVAKTNAKAAGSFNPSFYIGGLSPTQPVTVTPEVKEGLKRVVVGLVTSYVAIKAIEVAATVVSGGTLGWTLAL